MKNELLPESKAILHILGSRTMFPKRLTWGCIYPYVNDPLQRTSTWDLSALLQYVVRRLFQFFRRLFKAPLAETCWFLKCVTRTSWDRLSWLITALLEEDSPNNFSSRLHLFQSKNLFTANRRHWQKSSGIPANVSSSAAEPFSTHQERLVVSAEAKHVVPAYLITQVSAGEHAGNWGE